MKILFVDQLSKNTGHDTFMFAKDFADLGHEVCVAIADDYFGDTCGLQPKVVFHSIHEGSKLTKVRKYLKSLSSLLKFIKAERFDVIYLQWFLLPWFDRDFVRKASRYAKIITTVHDVISFNPKPFEVSALTSIYRHSSAIILLNEQAKAVFEKTFHVNTPTFVTSSAFCDKEQFSRVDKGLAREKLGIPEDAFVFLFYGSIRKSKGLDVLIKAFAKVYEKHPESFLLIGGAFLKIDGEYYEGLCKEYLRPENSRTDFKYVASEDEPDYFSASDAVCLPYISVFQSGVAQLGLMYDLPLVGTDAGSLPECIEEGKNGFLAPVNDVDAFARAMLKLFDADVAALSKRSRVLGESKFSLRERARMTANIIESLSGKSDPNTENGGSL